MAEVICTECLWEGTNEEVLQEFDDFAAFDVYPNCGSVDTIIDVETDGNRQ